MTEKLNYFIEIKMIPSSSNKTRLHTIELFSKREFQFKFCRQKASFDENVFLEHYHSKICKNQQVSNLNKSSSITIKKTHSKMMKKMSFSIISNDSFDRTIMLFYQSNFWIENFYVLMSKIFHHFRYCQWNLKSNKFETNGSWGWKTSFPKWSLIQCKN